MSEKNFEINFRQDIRPISTFSFVSAVVGICHWPVLAEGTEGLGSRFKIENMINFEEKKMFIGWHDSKIPFTLRRCNDSLVDA
jgi:hypothetical protein